MIKLIYCDGSVLTCYDLKVCGNNYICDDYRIVPICDIERIETDED